MERTAPVSMPLVLVAGARQEEQHPMVRLLHARGYLLQHVHSGQQALQRTRDASPDLIVVDLALRDMGALDLTRALREDPQVSAATPIAIASHAPLTRGQRLAAFAAGAWECVGPGSDPEEVTLKLEAFVRAKRELERLRQDGLVDPVTGLYNRQGLARRARELGAEAFRQPGALACVVFSVDPDPSVPAHISESVIARWIHALKVEGRLSDVIGRLSQNEFAILAPATDAPGAVKLAERLARSMEKVSKETGVSGAALKVRAGYEAVANVKYAPLKPLDLVLRAATALRTGRMEGGGWIRRFEGGPGASAAGAD